MRGFLIGLSVIGVAILIGGMLGRFWAPGDSLAVMRPQLFGLGLIVLAAVALAGAPRRALILLIPVLIAGGDMIWHWRGPAERLDGDGTLRLYQKNLLYLARDTAAIVADIRASGADVVTLQEVSAENLPVLVGLSDIYPYQLVCQSGTVGGQAVLSQRPILEDPRTGCNLAPGLALALTTRASGHEVLVASLHLSWPFPWPQSDQWPQTARALQLEYAPIVLGGDFNAMPWAASLRGVARGGGLERIGGYYSTFGQFGNWAPLPIDHVLIPWEAAGRVHSRPEAGSDHRGLLAEIALGP